MSISRVAVWLCECHGDQLGLSCLRENSHFYKKSEMDNEIRFLKTYIRLEVCDLVIFGDDSESTLRWNLTPISAEYGISCTWLLEKPAGHG